MPCIPVSGAASSTDLHHSHTVTLNLRICELKTIFITEYSEEMFRQSNTAWPNIDSKRQRKGWSVSSLSHLAIFENLLVVRGSLTSNGVHSRLEDDWRDTTGRVTCSQASCETRKWISTNSSLFLSFRFPLLPRSMERPSRQSCLFTSPAQLHEEDSEDESRQRKGWRKN